MGGRLFAACCRRLARRRRCRCRFAGALSPEAALAKAAFSAVKDGLVETLETCASGRELLQQGFAEDVKLASAFGASQALPKLEAGAYRNLAEAKS